MTIDIKKIIDLRMKLHRMAELAFEEEKTSAQIEKFIQKFSPDKIIKLAGTGRAFVFESGKAGKTTMFRAELDALPIPESDEIFNKSLNAGISHKCGHDGHMAILAALAEAISHQRPEQGKVVLLFQPAEETLQGAHKVIDEPDFKQISPDLIFALHNLPGYPENSVIIKEKNITSATNGITINLRGKPSHASNPKSANNPTVAVVKLLQFLSKDIMNYNYNDFVLSTPVYTRIGSEDFGITPGDAEIKTTLRAYDYADLDKMIGIVQEETKKIAFAHNLKYKLSYTDDSAPIFNHHEATELVKKAAKENNFNIIDLKQPFRWADDFGYYTIKYKGAFFGFGIGDRPDLHDKSYEFSDNSILPAVKIFYSIYKKLNFK